MKGLNVNKKRGLKKMAIGLALMSAGLGLMLMGDISEEANSPSREESAAASKYRVIDQVQTDAHVVEFFWYGCPHCLRLEKTMIDQGYFSDLGDLTLPDGTHPLRKKVPAVMSDLWELHARLFYALEQAGFSRDGHLEVMEMINQERPSSLDAVIQRISSRIIKNEASRNKKFNANAEEIGRAMFSPETNSRIAESLHLAKAVGLRGVPAVLVTGNKMIELGRGYGYEDVAPEVLSILRSE